MTEAISAFFAGVFGNNIILATILIAMIPLIELRGAIMFASSVSLWGAVTLSPWMAYLVSFIGSSLVVPIVALVFIPIVNWLKKTKLFKKLGDAIFNMVSSKSAKIKQDVQDIGANSEIEEKQRAKKVRITKMLGIFAFVAIPLPATGVWTGTAIAVVLGMKFWEILVSVMAGNAVAGLIITLLTLLLGDKSIYGLYVFMGLVIVFVIAGIIVATIKHFKRKRKEKI